MIKKSVIPGLFLSTLALAHACTMRDITEVPVTAVAVQPVEVTLLEGETQRFTAQARDPQGRSLPSGGVTWSSEDASVFSIDSEGNGEGMGEGQTRVWATLGGTRGSATVVVEPGPRIQVNQPSVSFFANVGGTAPDPLPLQINNGGGGSLGGLSASVEYPQGGPSGWLSLALAGTSTPTTLTLSILIGTLSEGTHTADLVLTSPDARNAPLSIPVQVTLTLNEPIIGLSTRTLAFQAEAGGDPPPSQEVEVTNLGGGTLTDLQAAPLYLGVGDWLSVELNGNSAPTQLVVTPDPASLVLGTYAAEVRVTGLSALNSPQSLSVTLEVVEAQGADLALTKTGPPSAAAGDQISYTLTAQNRGPVDATDVVLVDTLPRGVRFVSASGAGIHDPAPGPNGVVRWNVGSLAAEGPAQDFQVAVDIDSGTTGTLRNVASLQPVDGDPDPSNNTRIATTNLGSAADLVVGKTAPATGIPGGQIAYRLTARNDGPSDAADVVLTDTLPPGVTFVSATGGGVHDPTAGPNGVVTWAIGTLTVATGPVSVDVVAEVDATTTGAVVNVATVGSSTVEANATDNRATATTAVTGSDLVVGKTGPPTASPGQQISYNLTLQNTGPSDATGVVLTDTLPPGVSFVSASGGGTHSGAATGGVVTWTVGALSVGAGVQTRTVTVDVGTGTVGAIRNVAAVTSTSTDPDPSDDWIEFFTDVQRSDVSIVKTGPATAAPGAEISYTLTVTNAGPSPATGLAITDNLPANAAFVSATGDVTPVGGVLTWDLASLAVSGSQVYTVTVGTTAGASGTVQNSAAVSASQFDGNLANNTSTVTTTLVPSSDLAISKTGPPTANPGGRITWQISVDNLGPSDGTGVVVVDSLPAGVSFVSASGGGQIQPTQGNRVVWNIGSLGASAAPPTFDLVVDVATIAGGITNRAHVGSTTADPVPGNNVGSATTSVSGADLNLTKTAATTASPTIGDVITYTLTVRNDGPSVASNVVLHDTLPVGVTDVSATGTPTRVGRVLTWPAVATLGVGSTVTRTVTVTINTVGTLVNAADVAASAATPDYDSGDNYATASTTTASADVSITKVASHDGTPAVGERVTYTLTVQNAGPSDATGVVVTDALPADLSFVSATGGITPTGGVLTWDLGNVPAGSGPQVLSIVADIAAAGTILNTATVAATTPDPSATNNSDSAPFTAAALSPDLSTATVPDGNAGIATPITVQARDTNGNPMGVGGASVVVTVSGANAATPTVTDNGDGTYSASYTPTVAGTDNVDITLNGTDLGGSPYTSTVSPSSASAANSTATVPATATAGMASDITVQARDALGNDLTSGSAQVVVNVTGANTASPVVTDNGDGTYSASYTPTIAGTDNISITLNGTAISGSPYTSAIGPGPLSPGSSTATVPGGIAGAATNITIHARDQYGNSLNEGGAAVVVTVAGANLGATTTVIDNGDGTYSATYTPTLAGTDNVAITLNGTPISGSPYASTVSAGAVSASNSTATVPGGQGGVPTNITVQARDAYNNPLTSGGASVTVSVSGANNPGSLIVTDNNDGTYSAGYTPLNLGNDAVAVAIGPTALTGSPFTSTVTVGPVSAVNSTATVPASLTAGTTSNIVVQARDGGGNPLSSGGAAVVVTVTGANPRTPTVTDVGDGTYTASYTPTTAGIDNVAVTLADTAISGSPFATAVGAAALDEASSTATVPDGQAGQPTSITVQARDVYGNPVNAPGQAVTVSVTGANTATPAVTDNNDGTYSATYTPTNTGDDTVVITMNTLAVDGSPYSSTVGAGPASAATSTAGVPDGEAGVATEVLVQTFDALGNPLTAGGENVTVGVSGGNIVASTAATDQGDGSYAFSYTPTVAGTDDVAVAVNAVAITGSPFPSTVSPGPVSPAASTATVPNAIVGDTISIVVQARDAFGNPLSVGGETVVVTPAKGVAFSPTDNQDGTYTIFFYSDTPGNISIVITMNDVPISGSPFSCRVGNGGPQPVPDSTPDALAPGQSGPGFASMLFRVD